MKKSVEEILFIVGLLIGLSFGKSLSAQTQFQIPITIKEARPENVPGLNRLDSPVKMGIPLLNSYGISDVNQLGLTNAEAYQFRVLEHYASGNIRWLLVDTQVELPAGGTVEVKLVPGTGNTGGPYLAQDNGNEISINTGPAQFKVIKNTGMLLSEAVVNGQNFLDSQQGMYLEASDTDGNVYNSRFDPSATAVLEENGPVRAVVKYTGFLFDESSQQRFFGYTVRLHFFKGHQYVRSVVTFKNDYLENNQVRVFATRGASLNVATTLNQAPEFRMGTSLGQYSGTIDGKAYLVQAYAEHRAFIGNDLLEDRLTEGRGVLVRNGQETLQQYTNEHDYALGWSSLEAAGQSLHFAYRALSGYWAGGFELTGNGLARLQVLSDNAKPSGYPGYMFAYYAHETREFMVDFGGELSAPALEQTATYPLWGRPSYEQLAKTGALLGEPALTDYATEQAFFQENFPNKPWPSRTDIPHCRGEECGPIKRWEWATGGIQGAIPWGLVDLIDALRTGEGERWLNAYYWSYYTGDGAVRHSANWDWANAPNYEEVGTGMWDYTTEPTFNGMKASARNYVEAEHAHWLHLLPYYYLTGDEKIKEDIVDLVEFRFDAHNLSPGFDFATDWFSLRRLMYSIRDLAIASTLDLLPDFEQERNKALLDSFLDNFLYVTDDSNPKQLGWSDERGYIYDGRTNSAGERILSFHVVNEVGAMALNELYHQFYDIFPGDHVRFHKLRDRLLGLAYFNQQELLQYPEDQGALLRLPLDYFQDEHGYRGDQVLLLQTLGYEQTGDERFLERGLHLIPNIRSFQSETRMSELATQRFIYDFNNRDAINVSYPELTIEDQGNGTYLLSWEAPHFEVGEYILKYSEKKIVANLNFDNQNRTFEYNPDEYVNFWAAEEPAVNPGSHTTSFKIGGLDPSRVYHFSLKALGQQSNVTSVEENGSVGQSKSFEFEIINYPNPFNAQTTLRITADEDVLNKNKQDLQLEIYNMLGQQIKVFSEIKSKEVIWDASKQPSGVYFAKLTIGDVTVQSAKLILLK